jgi:Flp pilus assembly pilin Flp
MLRALREFWLDEDGNELLVIVVMATVLTGLGYWLYKNRFKPSGEAAGNAIKDFVETAVSDAKSGG